MPCVAQGLRACQVGPWSVGACEGDWQGEGTGEGDLGETETGQVRGRGGDRGEAATAPLETP